MGLEFGARTGKWSSRNMETVSGHGHCLFTPHLRFFMCLASSTLVSTSG